MFSLDKSTNLEKALRITLIAVSIVGGVVAIRKDLRQDQQAPSIPRSVAQPPVQQDLKTGGIEKKQLGKVKTIPEASSTFLEDPIAWLKRHTEKVPLRDRYSRD